MIEECFLSHGCFRFWTLVIRMTGFEFNDEFNDAGDEDSEHDPRQKIRIEYNFEPCPWD